MISGAFWRSKTSSTAGERSVEIAKAATKYTNTVQNQKTGDSLGLSCQTLRVSLDNMLVFRAVKVLKSIDVDSSDCNKDVTPRQT